MIWYFYKRTITLKVAKLFQLKFYAKNIWRTLIVLKEKRRKNHGWPCKTDKITKSFMYFKADKPNGPNEKNTKSSLVDGIFTPPPKKKSVVCPNCFHTIYNGQTDILNSWVALLLIKRKSISCVLFLNMIISTLTYFCLFKNRKRKKHNGAINLCP